MVHHVMQGWTPLMSAVSTGQAAIASYLLSIGADVAAANSGGRISLHYAASKGHLSCLQLLLKAGAKVNAKVGAQRTVICSNIDVCLDHSDRWAWTTSGHLEAGNGHPEK